MTGVLKLYFRMGYGGLPYFFAGMEQGDTEEPTVCMGLLLPDRLKDLIGLFLLPAPLWSAIAYSPSMNLR